jgi:hypothetical protein
MDAALVSLRNRIASTRAISIESIRIPSAILLIGLLVLASALLLLRRAAGALSEPLPAASLLAVGIAAAAAAVAAIAILGSPSAKWCASLSLPVLGFSVSLPNSSPIGVAAMWLSIGLAEIAIWKFDQLLPNRASKRITQPPRQIIEATTIQLEAVDRPTQKLTYLRTDEAALVEGWLRVPIEPGQRTLIAHVAFCPAFKRAPQVEAESVDGPDCSIRATTILPWGVRFEIKLDEPAESASDATMEFVAFES